MEHMLIRCIYFYSLCILPMVTHASLLKSSLFFKSMNSQCKMSDVCRCKPKLKGIFSLHFDDAVKHKRELSSRTEMCFSIPPCQSLLNSQSDPVETLY